MITLCDQKEEENMRLKRIICSLLSASMLLSCGIGAAGADNTGAVPDINDLSPLDDLELPYTAPGYKIAGNITLPEEIGGAAIEWTSSDESIISTEKRVFTEEERAGYGESYTEIPAGVVTRPAEDTEVVLTAEADGKTREYRVTVKAAPEKSYKQMDEDGDFTGYLYASFIEPPLSAEGQQVYFASSDDGMNWQDLNDNDPVLTSSMGTGSTRDHYILRSPEGDRFYLIATDLNSVESGKDWNDYAERGSKSLMIWESDDLVNWSEQRMVQIADENTGCAWAPEAIYDEITGEYVVYWSGHDIDPESATYGKKVVYVSRTRDFYSFTPQEKFVEPLEGTDGVVSGTSDSFIDTTLTKGSDGNFYRVTKYEGVSPTQVFMDVSKYPLGEYTRVKTNLSDNTFLGTEGPGWFKLNKDDAERLGKKYCLMLDGYNGPNKGVGFFPTVVDDLDNTEEISFERVTSDFSMRTSAKHGGILPITQEEYERVNEAYKNSEPTDLSEFINDESKVFDIADTYPEYPSGWTLPSEVTLDDDTYHYLGIDGNMTMGKGYGAGSDRAAIRFDMAANSNGDNIIRDTEGKAIIGYCYAPGNDGFWVGHGERSFGGNILDNFGTNRLPNYLKTVVGEHSDTENTGHSFYSQHDICTMILKNENGAVEGTDYTGEYYTVETYINGFILSTEYYSGHFNGIGSIESNVKQYYGSLCMYAEPTGEDPDEPTDTQKPTDPDGPDTDNEHLLFALNFDDETTNAQKGTAEAFGSITYADADNGTKAAVFDGSTSYISAKRSDGTPLLRGTDEAVITLKAKLEKPSTTNGWYFYTSWNDSAQEDRRRSYTGMYIGGGDGKLVAERFRDNSGTPTIIGGTSFGKWYEITYIIDGYIAELYIDGVFAGSVDYKQSGDDHTLSTILGGGDDIVTYFGKANWGDGEYAKGMFDDIAVYNLAPTIELGELSNIKSDISLPTASEETDGYTITWESSDPDTITDDGKVTRPQTGRKNVTLTATIAFDNKVLKRAYEAVVKGVDYRDLELDIRNEKGVDIQQNMYGLFFEDINYAADGGLYAELIENRSFEAIKHPGNDGWGSASTWHDPGAKWSAVDGVMEYNSESPLNDKNPTYLSFTGRSFQNDAYDGMYIEEGKEYKVSFYARKGSYTGDFTVSTGDGFSEKITDEDIVPSAYDENGWAKYEKTVTATGDARYAKFVISLDNDASVDFDFISVIPGDAVYGLFRRDLAEKLKDLTPGFVRFPGGCIIEGFDLENRYYWKDTVGPEEERTQNWNRWASSGYRDYNMTYGLGYYEFFMLCEYLGCDPLPVQNVGMSCQYNRARQTVPIYKTDANGNETDEYTDEFWAYIQDVLDLIEFANGTDFENSEWARLRRDMGHPEPFGLTMVGIGNEQWEERGNRWYERYEIFEEEIHKVYPEIKLIGSAGPSVESDTYYDAWNWIRENQKNDPDFTYAVDEHYYMPPQWFLENDDFYDDYDRNVKVFAGEYAAHTTRTSDPLKRNNLESALAEAAFMTGLERNADVVYLVSYAPLFARIGYTQWNPDMIWYNDAESYGTPTYYVQSMYSNNNGTYTLKSDAKNDYKVYHTESYDVKTGDIIVKISNPNEFEQRISLNVDESFDISGTMTTETLKGYSLDDVNSIEEPENIAPVTEDGEFVNGMDVTVDSLSFVVIRIHTNSVSLMNLTSFSNAGGMLSYELTPGTDFDGEKYDVYAAVYDSRGTLVGLTKNAMEGGAPISDDENYKLKVMVWEKDAMKPADGYNVISMTTENNSSYKLMSYTTTGKEYYAPHSDEQAPAIGNSLHLAVSDDGGVSYTPLNSNVGVLFAKADYSEASSDPLYGDAKMFRDPYLFKLNGGGYGVIAARADASGAADATDGSVMIFTSADLDSFEFIGYLELDDEAVSEMTCVYENGSYTIAWSDQSGVRKKTVTSDFKDIGAVETASEAYEEYGANIAYLTKATNVMNISGAEYSKLTGILNAPVNTGAAEIDDITVNVGETPQLPEKAGMLYSDGSAQEFPVVWDTSELDTSEPGEYIVTGTVSAKDYPSNFLADRADPCALKYGDKYYFVATCDNGDQTVLNIRVADTLDGIASAADHELWSNGGDLIWAPEIHEAGGKLMIFFATGSSWDRVQSHVMVLEGDDAENASDWSEPVRIKKSDGAANLIDDGITLDMTCFEWEDQYYVAWAQRRVNSGNKNGHESSNIYIAKYDPSKPGKLAGETAVISRPEFGWERTRTAVDEGPFVIENGGRLYMTIAANATDFSYGIKLMTLREGRDPMKPEDWIIKGRPLLCTAMNTSEPGPGHSSFTVDENGDPVLVYHWGRSGGHRTTTIKNVHFAADGEPVLNIPRGGQVKDEYKTVEVKVIVK